MLIYSLSGGLVKYTDVGVRWTNGLGPINDRITGIDDEQLVLCLHILILRGHAGEIDQLLVLECKLAFGRLGSL